MHQCRRQRLQGRQRLLAGVSAPTWAWPFLTGPGRSRDQAAGERGFPRTSVEGTRAAFGLRGTAAPRGGKRSGFSDGKEGQLQGGRGSRQVCGVGRSQHALYIIDGRWSQLSFNSHILGCRITVLIRTATPQASSQEGLLHLPLSPSCCKNVGGTASWPWATSFFPGQLRNTL